MMSNKTFEASWQVEDGYAGASRPQETDVSYDDLAECDTLEAAISLVESYVEDDFRNRITWFFINYDDISAAWEEARKEAEREESDE
jgi:hypothetical protein